MKTRFVVFSYDGDDDEVQHSFWELDNDAGALNADNPEQAMRDHARSTAADLEPDFIGHMAFTADELRAMAKTLDEKVGVTIQPYWNRVRDMPRESVVAALESISIQCYDTETVEELREALRMNLEDGNMDPDNLPEE